MLPIQVKRAALQRTFNDYLTALEIRIDKLKIENVDRLYKNLNIMSNNLTELLVHIRELKAWLTQKCARMTAAVTQPVYDALDAISSGILTFQSTLENIDTSIWPRTQMEVEGEYKEEQERGYLLENLATTRDNLHAGLEQLQQLLAPGELKEDFAEIEMVEELAMIVWELKLNLDQIQHMLLLPFEQVNINRLNNLMRLYLAELADLKDSVTSATLKRDIEAELRLWTRIRRNLPLLKERHYIEFKRQLASLWEKDRALFVRVGVAA